MAGFITYWSKDHIQDLKKENDTGPICVVFGGLHTSMPTIASVREGDIIYPVTVAQGTLYTLARLPVETIEPAYEYLIRELGNRCSALIPDSMDWKEYYNTPLLPHMCHQRPHSCCAKHAAVGTHGSEILARPFPLEQVTMMRFGPTVSKEKPLKLDKNGKPTIASLSGFVRRMSVETQELFEALF